MKVLIADNHEVVRLQVFHATWRIPAKFSPNNCVAVPQRNRYDAAKEQIK
jgi:hypothetical protein